MTMTKTEAKNLLKRDFIPGGKNVSSDELKQLKDNIYKLGIEIKTLDAERIMLAQSLGKKTNELSSLQEQNEKIDDLRQKWRIFELLLVPASSSESLIGDGTLIILDAFSRSLASDFVLRFLILSSNTFIL